MRCSELKMQPNEVRKQHRRRKVRSTQIKSILRRRHCEQGIAPASGARHTAITRSVEASGLHGTIGGKPNARDLWEDWGRARPFTLGRRYFNLGETHDVALAGAKFGSIDQIPEDFDEWEQVARTVEADYGWCGPPTCLLSAGAPVETGTPPRSFQITMARAKSQGKCAD